MLSVYCVSRVEVVYIPLYYVLEFRMKTMNSATFLVIAATVQRKYKCNKMQLFLLKMGKRGRRVE